MGISNEVFNVIMASEGVGIRLEGYPTEFDKIYQILLSESCHRKAADRILSRIDINGYDLLTVMNELHFDWIATELKKINVILTFIEPQKDWVEKKDGPWSKEDIEIVLKYKFRNEKEKNSCF